MQKGLTCSLTPYLLLQVDGKEYEAVTNNGPNSLHGGTVGFDKVLWDAELFCTPSASGVSFTYTSKDGEEGFPGTVLAKADYSLTADNEVRMAFTATTDAPTPINLCNHTYWNLSGDLRSNIHDHVMQLMMPYYTPVDPTSIPTGEIAPVAGTHFDFTSPTRIGDRIMGVDGGGKPGYDHNYVRSKDLPPGGFSQGLFPIARVTEPKSGRTMVVETNAPGVQFYTGNWLGPENKADAHRAFCLETQNFPDAVNKPNFPDPILRPGQIYSHITLHKFLW